MRTLYIDQDHARERWPRLVQAIKETLSSGKPVRVRVDEHKATRSLEQNDKLNAMCHDVARQVDWHGQKLDYNDWRHMFVAAYRKEQNIVPGINGGFVVLGASSRQLKVSECADVIEIIYAFGAEHGVRWGARLRRAS